jgi:hypothetical protein
MINQLVIFVYIFILDNQDVPARIKCLTILIVYEDLRKLLTWFIASLLIKTIVLISIF